MMWNGVLALLLAGMLIGCGESTTSSGPEAEATPAATPKPAASAAPSADVAKAEAAKIFEMRCVTCHGEIGAGDGPGAAGLDPKPRNFGDPTWQSQVSDDHIANIIQYGGAAVGKSPTMPGNPDLTSKPDVVRELVAYLRGLERS